MEFPNHAHLGALNLDVGHLIYWPLSKVRFVLLKSIHSSLLAQEGVSKENKVARQDLLKQRKACVVDR